MRTALAMVLLLLLAGLVQHPQPTELADEITVYSTDNYDPVADMTLGANQAIASNIAHTGTKNVAGQDWDVYRLTLDSTGQLNVEFDASNSVILMRQQETALTPISGIFSLMRPMAMTSSILKGTRSLNRHRATVCSPIRFRTLP